MFWQRIVKKLGVISRLYLLYVYLNLPILDIIKLYRKKAIIFKLRVNVVRCLYCALEAKLLGIANMASLQETCTILTLKI